MGLETIVRKGVDQAFKYVGDLKTLVTFRAVGDISYDHVNRRKVESNVQPVSVYGIITNHTSRNPASMGTMVTTLIVRSWDLRPIDRFDTFEIDGVVRKISKYIDNGYIYEIDLSGG